MILEEVNRVSGEAIGDSSGIKVVFIGVAGLALQWASPSTSGRASRQRAMWWFKVRICRLTLAPGVPRNIIQNKEEEDRDDEEDRILARELLHNAMEVAIASSSSRKVIDGVHHHALAQPQDSLTPP
jgi:hypothetical protein